MANTFCSLNIHCIFSTKERVPMLNPELRERLWPFLGGMAKQNGITARCLGGVADHVHLLLSLPTTVPIAKSHSIDKGWVIGLDSPDFSTTAQLQLATGLWRFQCQRLAAARNHSLHPKSGRTSSDPNFSTGIPGVSEAA
jgi:Transposase IS200 like